MAQLKENRVAKRPSPQNGEPGRRRAPYALRACEACRRRKGKCDGRQPCRYCAGRKQTCVFDSIYGADDGLWSVPTATSTDDSTTESDHPRRETSSTSSNQENIMKLLSSLQDQLNSLASRVQIPSEAPNARQPHPAFAMGDQTPEDFLSALITDAGVIETCLESIGPPSCSPLRQLYGLPSPEDNMKMARTRESCESHYHTPPEPMQEEAINLDFIPTASGHDDAMSLTQSTSSFNPLITGGSDSERLLRFKSLMNLDEVVGMLGVYQDVIGELHPIIDVDQTIAHAGFFFADAESTSWEMVTEKSHTPSEEDLIILNLALAIALHTESTPESSNIEALIVDCMKEAVNSQITKASTSMKQVTIILLKGCYEYFNDMPQVAWRMCGIAGRILMELGVHNEETWSLLADSPRHRAELWTLVSSIVILDRQWSAAAGLPPNFHDSSFSPANLISADHPYLKAMLSFIRVSNKLEGPMSQATKDQRYEDEENYELMNFQVEQWRKRAVGHYAITHPETWMSSLPRQPSTFPILLHLRAETIRSFLLKPWFFSRTDAQTSKKYLQPAIEVLFDICDVLYALNANTDIYRKQQPYYQELLASASTLGFVLTSSLEQNRATLLASLPPDLSRAMGRSYELAVALAASYVTRSRAAKHLSEQLAGVRGSLVGFGMLEMPGSDEQSGGDKDGEVLPVSDFVYDGSSGWDEEFQMPWPNSDLENSFAEGIVSQ
ncbi:hypothetical protein CORC01_10644 [Colletotrichum orchidophilum]|uniref:Zn(2)-C6 fungal-type domain-containing protein n=1 Tax=Colletotrichum orchidophilum TaxID=1209926 RepID=A0A1G4AY33_9PEZI|nr:uncharacterized protein CORC01_10644 [Colletotrichum orchidophilum]OHE94069.1 hypothetical protein CORC01_10644 [Colletotrichum orchidophilum]